MTFTTSVESIVLQKEKFVHVYPLPMDAALDLETSQLVNDAGVQTIPLLKFRLEKAKFNLDACRLQLSREDILAFEDRLLTIQLIIVSREAVPLEVTDTARDTGTNGNEAVDELNMLASDLHLLQKVSKQDKLDVEAYSQEKLSADLLEMTAAIKRNAETFQKKLEQDADLVSIASGSMQSTSGNMTAVGSRLQKYRQHNSLGWMFYLLSALFIVISLLVGTSIIQVFGKW